jgi:hypothetical protein
MLAERFEGLQTRRARFRFDLLACTPAFGIFALFFTQRRLTESHQVREEENGVARFKKAGLGNFRSESRNE